MINRDKVNKDLKIPFDNRGNQEGYAYSSNFIDNEIFEDILTYDSFSRGRSSIKFYFHSVDGRRFEMFASDFSKLVQNEEPSKGVRGEWAFKKQGANYGLVKVI